MEDTSLGGRFCREPDRRSSSSSCKRCTRSGRLRRRLMIHQQPPRQQQLLRPNLGDAAAEWPPGRGRYARAGGALSLNPLPSNHAIQDLRDDGSVPSFNSQLLSSCEFDTSLRGSSKRFRHKLQGHQRSTVSRTGVASTCATEHLPLRLPALSSLSRDAPFAPAPVSATNTPDTSQTQVRKACCCDIAPTCR